MAEQLAFSFGERSACACGRELCEHIEHYRGLCCMCILRTCRDNPEAFAHESPEAKREHLKGWLRRRAEGQAEAYENGGPYNG